MTAILAWFVTTKLGRAAGIALLCIGLFFGARWLISWHDEGVLAGYVKQVELDAAKAKLAETERQLEAGRKALSQYAELLAAEQEKNRAADEALEQEIKFHEAELAAKGRSCHISDDDRRWLLKP